MSQIKPIDYDIIYLSYDEPNAEKNYADLLTKIPWAKRVHGVEGSDAAHKACAKLSDTERFITIDGDNVVDPKFLEEIIDFKDDIDIENCVISWSGYNIVNGLTYGNGGIKCWPKDIVLNMRTHENADPNNPQSQVDFCWDLQYLQISKTYSYVYNNASPWQAWRAGFREGVKMSLYEGEVLANSDFLNRVHKKNLERLRIWQNIGADVENGLWAIYGARQGCYLTNCTDWNYVNVRDFEYLNKFWTEKVKPYITEDSIFEEIVKLGNVLNKELNIGISPEPLNSHQCKFFKSVYRNPERVPQNFLKTKSSEYDIVMITYNEPYAEENYENLKKRFPRAKRIHGVKGIHQAHIEAAKQCTTDMIWIVDGDAQVLDDFNFDYVTPEDEKDFVKVWRSKNPINDLEYGYGGIKLLPRVRTELMNTNKPDMTTSISRHFKPINVVSNITAFNTDSFNTWRSAFRECAKLASKVIDRQKSNETEERLKVWTTIGKDRPYGQYAIDGAKEGMKYGFDNKGDLTALHNINDFDWLKRKFDEQYNSTKKTVNLSSNTSSKDAKTNIPISSRNSNTDDTIKSILDRYEFLYKNENIKNLRRLYNDLDLSSLFKLTDNEELRKAVVEQNLHSIFRLADTDEDLRKAVLDKNFYSLNRLIGNLEDEFKIVLHNDKHALWRVLDKYTDSMYTDPLKKLYINNIEFDKDCLSKGQISSKKWLVETIKDLNLNLGTVFLCAGWYATLVPMLVENEIPFNVIRSFDIDPEVWKIAEIFNKNLLLDGWKFKAQTKDIMDINYVTDKYTTIKGNGDVEICKDEPDTIINTSCEHITDFYKWYAKIPEGKLVILQSNNYFEIAEHVNCSDTLINFSNKAPMLEVLYEGELELEKYTRYMKIGFK